MKLYDRVERVWNEVRALDLAEDEPLDPRALAAFDQLHYHGTDAVDVAARRLGVGPGHRVLDVGAGLGGPARYLAHTTGCDVDALELQADMHATAALLTRRAQLDGRVRHLHGDILEGPPETAYDAVISYLCILHIPDRPLLLRQLRAALRPGGHLYIEDFALGRAPSAAEADALRDRVQCSYLPTVAVYVDQLVEAGFTDIQVEDMSGSWRDFTDERLAAFRAARDRHVALHGTEIVDGLEDFYATVAGLFAVGVLDGARIHARA